MPHIQFDYSKVSPFVNQHELDQLQAQITTLDKVLREKTGAGADFTDWVDWPET